MNRFLPFFVLILAVIFIAQGCKKDDDAVQAKGESKLIQGTIAGVNGPTSGLVNQQLTFTLVWQTTDSLTRFHHILDSASHNTKFIKLFALTNVADTTIVKKQDVISYKFKAATAGTYYLKFYKADNSDKTAIIDTVNIK